MNPRNAYNYARFIFYVIWGIEALILTLLSGVSAQEWTAVGTILLALATFLSTLLSWHTAKRTLAAMVPKHSESLKEASLRLRGEVPNVGGYERSSSLRKPMKYINELFTDIQVMDLVVNHTKSERSYPFAKAWNFCVRLSIDYLDVAGNVDKYVEEILEKNTSKERELHFIDIWNGKERGYSVTLKNQYCRDVWINALHFRSTDYTLQVIKDANILSDEKTEYKLLKDFPSGSPMGLGSEEDMEFLKNIVLDTASGFGKDKLFIDSRVKILRIFRTCLALYPNPHNSFLNILSISTNISMPFNLH
ncbi:MAG: hypothetical protein ACYDDC_04285, partial [Thermoplasmataceae archaeon]